VPTFKKKSLKILQASETRGGQAFSRPTGRESPAGKLSPKSQRKTRGCHHQRRVDSPGDDEEKNRRQTPAPGLGAGAIESHQPLRKGTPPWGTSSKEKEPPRDQPRQPGPRTSKEKKEKKRLRFRANQRQNDQQQPPGFKIKQKTANTDATRPNYVQPFQASGQKRNPLEPYVPATLN